MFIINKSLKPKHSEIIPHRISRFAFRPTGFDYYYEPTNRSYTDLEPRACLPCLETETPDIDAQSFPHHIVTAARRRRSNPRLSPVSQGPQYTRRQRARVRCVPA
jgi:hypothetical protein